MNVLPPTLDAVPARQAKRQADAFDDAYAWVGYESAYLLASYDAEAAAWPGVNERAAD